MRVQGAQGGEDVGGDLRRAVRGEGAFGEQRGERAGGDAFADDPQAAVLGEDVEDLVQLRVVGQPGRGGRGLQGAPYGGVPRRTVGAGDPVPVALPVPVSAVPGSVPVRAPGVEEFRVHDFGQRHLAYEDLLPAVRVEGAGLGELVLVRRRHRQAVALGEHSSRVLVHDASPARDSRRLPGFARELPVPLVTPSGQNRSHSLRLRLRTVFGVSRYVPGAWVEERSGQQFPQDFAPALRMSPRTPRRPAHLRGTRAAAGQSFTWKVANAVSRS